MTVPPLPRRDRIREPQLLEQRWAVLEQQQARHVEAATEARKQMLMNQPRASEAGNVKAQMAAQIASKLDAERQHNEKRLLAARQVLDAEKQAMREKEVLAAKRYASDLKVEADLEVQKKAEAEATKQKQRQEVEARLLREEKAAAKEVRAADKAAKLELRRAEREKAMQAEVARTSHIQSPS